MPVARLSFPSYQTSNENGGGGHPWINVAGAGATAAGAGAYSIRDPNSADMNWLRSYGDGARGGASIPDGSIITGIVIGFEVSCQGGNQTGGTYSVGIFKNGSPVGTFKSGSIANNSSVGGFGASNDLWGLGALATPAYFASGIYFGHHCNFPNITANISVYSWNGYMDIYYNDPVPIPTSIGVGAGNNQNTQVSTQFATQMYAIVRDQGGNPMPGISVTFTLPASGASGGFNSVGGPKTATAVTNSSGGAVSPFFFANATTGTWQPVADVTGSSPLIFTMFQMTNDPVPVVKVPTTISRQQGDGQQAAVSTQFNTLLKVRVFDQFVQPMPNVEINWPPPGSGASGLFQGGNPYRSFTDVGGVATAVALYANSTPGAWTLPAAPVGFPAVVASFGLTNLANNAPPTPTSGQIVSGSNQSAALNANFPNSIQVKVLDQYGSPYAGATVVGVTPGVAYGTWLSNSSVTKSVVTDSQGIANFGTLKASGSVQSNWAVTMTGNAFVAGVDQFTANFTVGGLNNVDATIVTALTAISGTGQLTQPSTSFALPLVARATNGLGAGVQNYAVTFTAPGSAATCTFTGSSTQLVNTDVNGYATSAVPVASATEGSYTVVASGAGGLTANFPLQNGNTYDPEVCTALANLPSGGTNSTLGSVGGTPTAWVNPGNASLAAQGATSTLNGQQPPNSNRSQGLFLVPLPAAALAIPDTAKITKMTLNWSQRINTSGAQVGLGNIFATIIKNGAAPQLSSTHAVPLIDQWTNQTTTKTFTAVTMTGADLKTGTTGMLLTFGPASNFGSTQDVRVNGCQLIVCYQTIIPPPVQDPMGPLLVCQP